MSIEDKDEENTTVERSGASVAQDFFEDDEHVAGMYKNWFLDYASYVILDRAVPNLEDGLKPVQRRLLHALWELDDGRFNKAANVIGHTMRYHPHGDASIGDALVKLGQKELLVDTQGNWGNILTGDSAAAPRYIEARLSELGKTILFNPDTTEWQDSYDGRNKEPVKLPVKFPLLLSQGVEGIAVGLSTKILPHNFIELVKASIGILQGKKPKLLPDFPTGGIADFNQYEDGKRGGKIRVRAVIEVMDLKTLRIKEIPFGTTTGSLIESILAANDKGKIKIRKVEDNTAEHVEILIHLPPGASPEPTVDALYAFTDCEVSISPNCCIIKEGRPDFCGVGDVLQSSTDQTVDLLKRELEIKRHELQEKLHFASLERIFIEEKIYRNIETATTWDAVLSTIDKGLAPFAKKFYRAVTQDDLTKLTEIKIKRISKFDGDKAREAMEKLKADLKQVEHDLENLVEFAISFYKMLLEKFGKGRERRTKIDTFSAVQRQAVAAVTQKIYVNRKEGFIGTSLKKDEFVAECSELDEVIAFTQDGQFMVAKVADKTFVGKNIVYVELFQRANDRCIYHLIYRDGKDGAVFAKRFNITSITRNKLYPMTKGTKDSRVFYFSVNPNGEAETVQVELKDAKKPIKINFADIEIKERKVVGQLVTKEGVKNASLVSKGKSTLSAMKIFFDRNERRLNTENRGDYLGEFKDDEKILVIYPTGSYELTNYSLTNMYADDLLEIRKFYKGTVMSVVYYDGDRDASYVKRFQIDPAAASGRQQFVDFNPKLKILLVTTAMEPKVKVTFKKKTNGEEVLKLSQATEVKGLRALGAKIGGAVKSVEIM